MPSMPEATSSWSILYARMPISEWVSSLSWVYSLLPDFNYWNWPEVYRGSSFVLMVHSFLVNSFTLWLQFSPVCWTDNRQIYISRCSLSFLEFQIYLSNCLHSCLKFILVQCLKLNNIFWPHCKCDLSHICHLTIYPWHVHIPWSLFHSSYDVDTNFNSLSSFSLTIP